MKILFLGWEFPPRGGGVGAYMMHMARALVASGHQAIIVTSRMKGCAEEENLDGVIVYRIYNQSEKGSIPVMQRVVQLAEKHAVDWIEGADHLGECAGLLKMRIRPAIVIKVHGCNAIKVLRDSHVLKPWQKPLIMLSILRQWRTVQAEKFCIQHADLLLTPSWRMACELKRQYQILPKFLSVVPNTVIDSPVGCDSESDRPTLLFVGRIDIGKGIQWLSSILKNLRQKNICLEIAGSDSYARGIGFLQNWLEQELVGIDVEVRFLGKVSQSRLAEAYQRAWVVILPSRWDNFPTVILEAMQHSKPVVASPYGGMVEMLEGTKSRIALPDSNDFSKGIDAFIVDKKLRREAGLSMRVKLETVYSPKNVATQYIQAVSSGLSL